MSWLRFASLNLIGALLWAPIVAGAGYALGSAVAPLLEDGRYGEYFMIATVILVGVVVWLLGRWRARRHSKKPVRL